MAERYTGKAMDRRYAGEAADITYNLKRCIHAEHCVHHLAQVFDTSKRPWINPNGAPPEEVTRFIPICPSGALHVECKDGQSESAPPENVVRLWQDGPLQFHGTLEIVGATVNVQDETRATLCRCGGSRNKPFCDNAHRENQFAAQDTLPGRLPTIPSVVDKADKLKISVQANGPLQVEGRFEIRSPADQVIFVGTEAAFCRCGHSSNKPFCDGTHSKIEFQAE